MDCPDLSVIIPTLNEAEVLPVLLGQLQQQQEIQIEVIVTDGGSADSTVDLAEQAGCKVVCTGKGRGLQMNRGAESALADQLLFLHADSQLQDSRLLKDALTALNQARKAAESDRVAGHFSLEFIRSSAGFSLAYRYYEEKTALNRQGVINGDQGLLLSRNFFRELGGFSERWSFLEDQEIAGRIFKIGNWITLPGKLSTSARRFETEGLARRMILSAIIMGLFSIGFDPFFRQASQLYRQQQCSSRLKLLPFFKLCHRLLRRGGWKLYFSRWLLIGRCARQNCWQVFYFGDVLLRWLIGMKRSRLLTFYDRILDPATNFAVFDWLAALLAYCWFYLSFLHFSLFEDYG